MSLALCRRNDAEPYEHAQGLYPAEVSIMISTMSA
jgi:hypothetical protein